MKSLISALLMGALATMVLMSACRGEDDFVEDPEANLIFSVDTLMFDTVFTTAGSATFFFTVRNPYDQRLLIDEVAIQGEPSFFRMNVDGIPGNRIEAVEIPEEDSIYVFVEVTIDPNDPVSVSPFVITDEITFTVNGMQQSVVLEAWGQNANYVPGRFNRGGGVIFSCDFGEWVWDDPKPYVIHGILVVDSCTLRIPAGRQVHLHGGLVRVNQGDTLTSFYNDGRLVIGPSGRLVVEGTADEPVVFQGDRLEPAFENVPGQWFGIVLAAQSKGHNIQHAVVKNGILGIAVDSAAELDIQQTEIFNVSSNGLLGIHSNIQADNCLLYNCGGNAVQLTYGGQYRFRYCTFTSYGNQASALRMDNALCLDAFCADFRLNPLEAVFQNCILYGSQRDEIEMVNLSDQDEDFDYRMEQCIVRVDDLPTQERFLDFFDRCNPCQNLSFNQPLFLNESDNQFSLDTLSAADGYAVPLPDINVDLIENLRDPNTPDAGALELNL